ncbi:MAG: hypothetical protein NVS3B19_17560 [Ginsengibacter sp.]
MHSTPDYNLIFKRLPGIALLLLPDAPVYTIVEATDEVLKNSPLPRNEVIGRSLFYAFPDNPDAPADSGSSPLRDSLDLVIKTKKEHRMEVTRYDVIKEETFSESYWEPLNTPIYDDEGNILYILHTAEDVTERILNEKKASTSEKNFEFYISQSTEPFSILKGRDLVFTFANEANRRLMNNRPLIGKRLVDALPELRGGAFISILENVFDTGIPYHAVEVPFDAIFDGSENITRRFFNFSYIPYRNTSGLIEGILVSCHDVTQQVESRWQVSKTQINKEAYNLFMQAPVGFSLVRGDNHVFELVNTTGLLLTDQTEAIIGKPVMEVFPEIASQGFIDILNKVKQTGEVIKLNEIPVQLKNTGIEETRYFNIVYQPYYEANKIEGVLSVSIEVTEQVKAKQKVEELRDRFENMANNLPNLSWIANSDGWIFWYNERWYEYTGTTPEQMEGWGWKSVHDPEVLPEVLDKWQASIFSGQPFEMVFPLKGADGTFKSFLTRVVPIRNKEGEIIRWIGTNTDITPHQ